MPTWEVDVNGETFEIDAPDEAGLRSAVERLSSPKANVPGGVPGGDERTLANAPARYLSGAWKHLNPVEMVKGAYQLVTRPTDVYGSMKHLSEEQWGKAFDAAQFTDEEKAAYSKASPPERAAMLYGKVLRTGGHGIAAIVPGVGPAAADAAGKIADGDVAGGMGEFAGMLAAPGLAKIAASPIKTTLRAASRAGAPAALESAAASKIAEMAPKVGPNKTRLANKAREIAPALVRDMADNGAPLTKGGFHEQVKLRLLEAESALDDASNARLPTKTFSTKEILKGLEEAKAELTAKAVGKGKDVVPGPNAARVAMIDQAIEEVRQVRGPMVNYETIRRIRQAYDGPAKTVYNPSLTADFLKQKGSALGAADVTRVLRNQLAKWDPQTAAANAKYSLYKSADDVLSALAEVERARPKVGRQIMARLTGVLAGGQAGPAGAAAGFLGAPLLDSALASGFTTTFKTAATLQRLADAIRAANISKVHSITHELRRGGLTAGAFSRPDKVPGGPGSLPAAAENEDDSTRIAGR